MTDPAVEKILEKMRSKKDADVGLVKKAYDFAREAHKEQKRFSGEPFFIHPFNISVMLADLRQDAETVAAGLLHDIIEDVNVSKDVILKEFGEQVLFLVEGVSKLGKIRYQGTSIDHKMENLRKLFIAIAADVRVLIIKLVDRLHNIRTLEHVREEKRRRIAIETLEVYARLAERFGMWKIKEELEDRAFPYAYPDKYELLMSLLQNRLVEDEKRIQSVHERLSQELSLRGISQCEISYRRKALYSTYKKLVEKEMDLTKVYDIAALRVIVPTVEDCYKTLGIIHSTWTPLPGRVKDYISTPKQNGYRSIHTDIFTRDNGSAEVQIRTKEMHIEDEYGIASHLAYSENGKPIDGGHLSPKQKWIRQLLLWQKRIAESDSTEFMENLRLDFFKNQIFIFTPKGDVIQLPEEATVIDYAYRVHTDIGNEAVGAWVNQKYVGLNHPLKNGDIVNVDTRKGARPSFSWLKFAKTATAKKHIRSTLAVNRRDRFNYLKQ